MSRIALATLLVLATLPAWSQEASQPASPLKVRKIVVYKHGVGYFEREGKVKDDQQISLTFKSAQMKDLLKSLYAVDLSGGRISTIGYDTKDPLSKQLEDILIRLPEGNALTQFLSQLKGARVEAAIGGETVTGSVVGIEPVMRQTKDGTTTAYKLVLYRDDGKIQPIDLLECSTLKLLDEALQKDFKRILDIHLKAKYADRKTVTLNATGKGERDVRVGYIVETPIWKTSYRLLFDENRKPLLQGWAILENTTDEDWDQVDVSFVAGSPMSFIMDLYTAYYPQRPEIGVGVGRPEGPQGYAPAPAKAPPAVDRFGRARKDLAEKAKESEDALADMAKKAESRRSIAEELESSVAPAAAGVEVGELFAYKATEKISVKRGQAALVPILSERIDEAERVLFYRPSLSPRPMNAFSFRNTTSLTLESGPVTFFDGSTCVGEGLMRKLLKKGMKDVVPYAIEAGVTVEPKVNRRDDPVTRGAIANGVLTLTYTMNQETVYAVKNQLDRDVSVILDHAKSGGFTLAEPAKPEDDLEGHYRFRVEAKAGATAEFKVRETMPVSTQVSVIGTPAETIRFYLRERYLSEAAKKFLGEVMALEGEINRLRQEEAELAAERQRLSEDQNRARQNVAVLRDTPAEQEMRQKYLKRIEEAETRMDQIRTESKDKGAKRAGMERDLSKKVSEFKEE